MFSLLLALQQATPLPRVPYPPTPTRTARCVGVGDRDQRRTLTVESRWIEAENNSAVFVVSDSSGVLKPGAWLENQNTMYRDGDRKQGVIKDWDDQSFSKRIGNRYVRVVIQETGLGSASILYLVRPYSDREETAMRHYNMGTILLAGRCSLFVDGKPVR